MDLVDLIESRRFLGGEFLVWLWHHCAEGDHTFQLPGGSIVLAFDDQLVLQAFLAESEQSQLTGGAPTQSPEARTALRAGKRISKAKLRILQGEREWLFTVAAGEFTFSSVKVPAVLKRPDERLLERASLMDELSEMWHALYGLFLTDRLGPDWEASRLAIAAWADEAQ